MDINVGIGDHLVLRMFLDGIKDQYDRIAVTHSRPGMAFWHNNNAARWDFNLKLGKLLFGERPYELIQNARFPFFPNERIVREINNKPVKPNVDCLCVGKPLDVEKYIILTTKVRQLPKSIFEQSKNKLTPIFQKLANARQVVIIGEREVEKTKEYSAAPNKDQVYGIYDYWKSILPNNKILDLTIPALGVIPSTLPQVQQDCLIMNKADAVITFGIGGNVWLSACAANNTIGYRTDNDIVADLIQFPTLSITKNIDDFISIINSMC